MQLSIGGGRPNDGFFAKIEDAESPETPRTIILPSVQEMLNGAASGSSSLSSLTIGDILLPETQCHEINAELAIPVMTRSTSLCVRCGTSLSKYSKSLRCKDCATQGHSVLSLQHLSLNNRRSPSKKGPGPRLQPIHAGYPSQGRRGSTPYATLSSSEEEEKHPSAEGLLQKEKKKYREKDSRFEQSRRFVNVEHAIRKTGWAHLLDGVPGQPDTQKPKLNKSNSEKSLGLTYKKEATLAAAAEALLGANEASRAKDEALAAANEEILRQRKEIQHLRNLLKGVNDSSMGDCPKSKL